VSSQKPSLNDRLDRLQLLQDLDIHLREAKDPKFKQTEEEMGFVISEEGIDKLQGIRDRQAAEMQANETMKKDLRIYERIRQRYERVLERLADKICLGCWATQPMAVLGLSVKRGEIPRCENCGRILHWTGGLDHD
jgi:predicted  nucleic acid-binding Zn-ribbon protein